VLAQTMARALADQVELALERIALEPVARGDEELLDVRLRGARRVAEVRAVRIDRHRTPADQPLAFLRADPRDRLLADRALVLVGRQEHDAGAVAAGLGQLGAERRASNLCEELVRQRGEDAGAVAGVRLGAARTAMIHSAQQVIRVANDLMTADAFDVRDEADAAAVVLHFGAVETVRARPSDRRARANHSAVVLFRRSHGVSLAETASYAGARCQSVLGRRCLPVLAVRHRSCAV